MEKAKNKNISFYIKVVIWLVIVAVIWNIPPSGALTEVGMHTLACFVGLIFGMITLGFVMPCFAMLFLMSFSGAYPGLVPTLSAGFGSEIFLMIFSILLMSGIISYSGLARIIALRMINAKVTTGRPWVLTFFIMLISAILALFVTPMVPIAIVSSICVEVMRNLEIEKGNKWALMTLLAVGVVAIASANILPFQSGPVILNGVFTNLDPRVNVTAGEALVPFMIVGLIWTVLVFAFMFFLVWIVSRKSIDKLYSYKPSEVREPFTRDAKLALVALIVYIAIQIAPLFMPAGSSVRGFFEHIGLIGSGFLVMILCMLVCFKNGKFFITFQQINECGIDWNMLSMLIGISAITGPMTTDSTGILTWLTDLMEPIVSNMSPYAILVFICIVCIVLTNISDNMALFFVIYPLVYSIGQTTGVNVLFLLVWSLHTIQLGILLPCSTPHIALIFTKDDTGYVKKGPLVKWSAVILAFTAVICVTIAWATNSWFPNVLG